LKRCQSHPDPIRPVTSLLSGRSAKSRLCELELYKAAVGDLTQSAITGLSPLGRTGRSNGGSAQTTAGHASKPHVGRSAGTAVQLSWTERLQSALLLPFSAHQA